MTLTSVSPLRTSHHNENAPFQALILSAGCHFSDITPKPFSIDAAVRWDPSVTSWEHLSLAACLGWGQCPALLHLTVPLSQFALLPAWEKVPQTGSPCIPSTAQPMHPGMAWV